MSGPTTIVLLAASVAVALVALPVRPHLAPLRRPVTRCEPPDASLARRRWWSVGPTLTWRWIRLITAAATAVWALGPLLVLVVATAAIAWRSARPVLDRRRTARRIAREIPDALELLLLLVRAGLTPHQAVRVMAAEAPSATRDAFRAVVARVDRGTPLADALGSLVTSLGDDVVAVVDTLAFSLRWGAPIGDTVAQLSADVRRRRRRLAEADARRLPVRLAFPLVFCSLPSFLLVAIAPAVLAAISSIDDTPW